MIESLLVFVSILLPTFDVIQLSLFLFFFFFLSSGIKNLAKNVLFPENIVKLTYQPITETFKKLIVHADKHQ